MADVNANIGVNIDTSDALNQLKNLQRQISAFHQSVAKSSSAAAVAQRDLQKNFINGVNAIQGFSAELRTVRGTAESFTNSLEKNKFSIQQYFRYAASQSKTFGKNFTAEFSAIEKTAIERVKTLQTQYIKMGRDANGAMQAIAIRPTVLNMKDLGTQTAIAAQKQVLFNQLIKQGSTNLLNFGKNTQWAGRQLMVGFTLPLATLGVTAGRVFMDMEKAALKFKKVYGDLFTAPGETDKALDSIVELGVQYTKYGVAVSDALEVASDAAAAGFQGVDLQNQTTAALKLSVLGQMELQKALETTIALQNAFNISSKDLAGEIDFLNAVENQTVVSLDDITEAVPRVAPVIKSLGGDVRDLAFFLAAMKEGGVNAAQGANALKSGLASLINPTESATQFLGQLGIDLKGIVSRNTGDISATVVELAKSLDTLDPDNRARAIEQLFGKFQFARMSALFANVAKDGTQASRVLDLAGSSLSDLANLSEKELGVSAASAMNKFRASIEQLKVALAPLGELFLKIATPFIDFATGVLKAFNNLPDGMKQAIGTVVAVIGGLGPVLLMTFGLINNGIANMIKFFATVRLGYLKITGQAKGVGDETQYMTQEQLEAAAAAASLDQAHAGLTQRFTAEKTAVDALRLAYEQAAAAGARFAMLNPGMMKPGAAPRKMAKGGVVTVGGRGNKDTEPALLTPGEAVIPAPMVKKYGPLIEGMIAGNIPGYAKGVMLGMPKSAKSVSKSRDAAEEVYQMFLKSSYAGTAPTNYGHQISPTSGHSFPIFGLGGVYQKGNKQVFVKPVLDEKAALAEMRSTEISRRAHGLEAPEQRIVVIKDPMDVKGVRRFLALESDLDPKFVNNQPMGLFNEEQYFRQLVASLLRVDKDLSGSNVFGNVVADAGPAGVFGRASGLRNYEKNLPSMEDQALINLLGIKGGAKRAFAESTLGMMAGITPEQYRQRMLGEIQKVLPRLKETVASFKLTDPTEVGVYDDMIKRLEQGLGVDWRKFHAIHSAVKPGKPKAATQAIPGYKNGVVAVPGPKGAGDVVPAMLSPGEAVIPAEFAKKYAPLINAMVAGNIPGYKLGRKTGMEVFGSSGEMASEASHMSSLVPKNYIKAVKEQIALEPELANLVKTVYMLRAGAKEGEEELSKVSMTLQEIADLPEGTEVLAKGYTAGGTTVLETKARNQAMEAAGIAGSPETLQDQVEAGKKAKIALDSGSKNALKWSEELESIIVESEEATRLLNSANSKQEELNFVLDKHTKAYSQGLQANVGGPEAAEADELATKRMTKIKELYYKEMSDGVSHEQALNNARIRASAAISHEADLKDKDGRGMVAVGPEGSGAQRLRGVSSGRGVSRGGIEINRTFAEGEDPEAKFGPRGKEGRVILTGIYNQAAKDAEETATTFSRDIAKKVLGGVDKGLKISSPSGKFEEVAQQVGAGVDLAKDDAKMAGEQLGKATTNAVAKTAVTRRASSDPQTQAEIDRINQRETQATRDSLNIAQGASRKPRRATREADNTAATEKIWERSTENVSNFSDKVSKAAFGLSSVTGILSVFGADLSGILPVISGISGALFGLIEISRLLVGTKIAEIAATRLLTVAKTQGATGDIASAVATGNVANMFKTMFVQGKGLAGFFTNVGKAAMTLLRGFGLIGLAITALTVGIPLVVKAFEDNANKVNGLGAAANLTEDKLKFLADKFGVTAKSINWAERTASAQATAGKSTEEKEQVVNLMVDPQFEEAYKTEIAGILGGTKEQANLALESLAMQLRNSGFDTQAIDAIIAAIIAKTGRTDLELKFNSILISDANTAKSATDLAAKAAAALEKDLAAIEAEPITNNAMLDPLGIQYMLDNMAKNDKILQVTQAAAGVAKTSLDSLTLAFESGNISAEVYGQSLSNLFDNIQSVELLDSLAEKMGLKDLVSGLDTASDKALILKAAVAGVDTTEDRKILEDDKATDGDKAKARNRLAQATTRAAAAQAKQNAETAVANALAGDNTEAEGIERQIAAYHDLVGSGINAALAYEIVGDAAKLAAIEQARLTDATNGNTAAFDALMAGYQRTDAAKKEFAALSPFSGGGGQKSAFREAMDQLKEQQQEAKSSTMAYAKLRSAGMSVAESSEIAKDSILAAALASEKVGSKKWNELVAAIRSARAEEEAWLRTTPEGRADQFEEVYGKVMDVFNSQEAVLQSNNEAAMKTTNKIIEVLEKQIDGYNRVIGSLERDLAKIADKEEEINEKYDEKTKALETVKKLNQDLINQQKSQLSIADALSRGDISAAASAMQDSRAQNAAAQGNATGNALDAARQSELDSLTENGRTRADIEIEIKNTKLLIEEIEFGALQNARDMITAADEALELAVENLRVQGLSKTEWENIQLRIDSSRASANLYEAEVAQALVDARELVGEWNKLNETYTTTHVVNTIHTSSGGSSGGGTGPAPASPTDPNADNPTAQAQRVKDAQAGTNGLKVSERLRTAANANPPVSDSLGRERIATYLSKITKAQADSIISGIGGGGAGKMLFLAKGGMVNPTMFAKGGFAKGTDTVPSMLTPGEFVVNKSSTKKFAPILEAMNSGTFRYSTPTGPKVPNNFSKPVYNMPEPSYSPTGGATSLNNKPSNTSSEAAQSNSVYNNYSLSVNVSGTNSSANDIANVVMNRIKAIDSQQVRKQVIR